MGDTRSGDEGRYAGALRGERIGELYRESKFVVTVGGGVDICGMTFFQGKFVIVFSVCAKCLVCLVFSA